jgi:hypothetical protein
MAEPKNEDEGIVSPVGMVLHEPTFPNISGDPADPAHTEHASSESMADQLADESNKTQRSPPGSSFETARPTQQRWATERPKPSVRHSLLGRMQQRSEKRPGQPERSATITFDAESSDSSDSSDDEKDYPRKGLGHVNDLTRQATQKRSKTSSGPFSRLKISNEHFNTKGRVSKADGRLKLSILEENLGSGYIAKALGAAFRKHGNDEDQEIDNYDNEGATKIAPEDDEMEHDPRRRIKLNIVIIIIGSRGDIQPFIRIGKILKEDYGHRVRLATHPAFKDFVEKDSGLEFFSVGGNPAELMAFMVKNPGLIPNIDTIKEGEIGRRRAQMYEMFQGMWRACINATDDETDKMNAKMSESLTPTPSRVSFQLTLCSGRQGSIRCRCDHCESSEFRAPAYCGEAGYTTAYDVHVRTRIIPLFVAENAGYKTVDTFARNQGLNPTIMPAIRLPRSAGMDVLSCVVPTSSQQERPLMRLGLTSTRFPYTPTSHFPHPLANIKASNVEPTYSNFMSYPLVEMMMWQGLGDLINRFRTQVLHLEEVSRLWAPGQLYRLKVPYTYMWSPGLIPKPKDWGPEIDISGFVFLDLASSFTPPDELKKFLDAGEPPVYIGFGSIVVDDPDQFTKVCLVATPFTMVFCW